MLKILLVIICLAWPFGQAAAFSGEEDSDGKTRTLSDYIADYVELPEGATDWKLLGRTEEKPVEGRDADGLDYAYTRPVFPENVKALDGKAIKIRGFMFPLDAEEAQQLFLFGPFPVSCPFHYHAGPSLVIEARTPAGKPIDFSYDAMTLEGILELVPDDPDNSVFYRLKDARIVK